MKQYIFKHKINTIIKFIVFSESMVRTYWSGVFFVFFLKEDLTIGRYEGKGVLPADRQNEICWGETDHVMTVRGVRTVLEAPGTLVAWAPCQSPCSTD